MKAKQLQTICAVLIFLSFLWSCSGSSQKVTPHDIQVSQKETGHILPDGSKAFKTRTGKTIIVSETHPVGQSLSNIEISTRGFAHHYPEMQDDKNFKGYRGHDTFKIKGQKLVRTFPLYNEGDSNLNPTIGTRKLVYGLYPGEAMWQLKIEKSEFLIDP